MKHAFMPVFAFMALCATSGAQAASERVGQATLVKTAVTGQAGPIVVKSPVHRNERIRTSKSGLGEFLFRDGTKLAVGAGSSVVVDKFVFDDDKSVQTLSIKAAKGTFRWISGNSRSTAYSIKTPSGTIGVRGTRFDFYVGPDGTTAVVLLSGAAQFCGAGGCVQLRNRCDCVIAKPGRRPDARRGDSTVLAALGNEGAFPFLSGRQRLSGGFGASTGCGMSARVQGVPGQGKRNAASATPRAAEPTPDPPAPEPQKPDPPPAPEPQKPDPPPAPEPQKPDPPPAPEPQKPIRRPLLSRTSPTSPTMGSTTSMTSMTATAGLGGVVTDAATAMAIAVMVTGTIRSASRLLRSRRAGPDPRNWSRRRVNFRAHFPFEGGVSCRRSDLSRSRSVLP